MYGELRWVNMCIWHERADSQLRHLPTVLRFRDPPILWSDGITDAFQMTHEYFLYYNTPTKHAQGKLQLQEYTCHRWTINAGVEHEFFTWHKRHGVDGTAWPVSITCEVGLNAAAVDSGVGWT